MKKTYLSTGDKKIAKILIYNGIPESKHGEFWFVVSGAKKEMNEHPGYYDYLLNNYPKEISLLSEKQINLDITRAFPEDPFFHNQNIITKLKNILLCYSKRNLSIGYVQGFNFIVGRLLKFIPNNDEKVFWIFVQIIERILPIDFYSEMAGVMASVDILICMFRQMYIPELIDSLQEYVMIYLKNILMQWFLSLFAINFPYDCTTLIWDALFTDGKIVLFKVAVCLIKMLKEDLMNIKELEQMKNYIVNFYTTFNDTEFIKFSVILRKFEFDERFIDYNYYLLIKEIVDVINMNNATKVKRLKEEVKYRTDTCDPSWPFCIYDCDTYYSVTTHLVLRTGKKMQIDWNYFNADTPKNDTTNNETVSYDNILIERLPHFCEKKNKNELEDSCISTGTEKSNDKSSEENDNEHILKKKKFKQRRKNQCISSVQFMKERSKKKDSEDEEDFLSRACTHYMKYSVAESFVLRRNEESKEINV